jgi:hypothetical protein
LRFSFRGSNALANVDAGWSAQTCLSAFVIIVIFDKSLVLRSLYQVLFKLIVFFRNIFK